MPVNLCAKKTKPASFGRFWMEPQEDFLLRSPYSAGGVSTSRSLSLAGVAFFAAGFDSDLGVTALGFAAGLAAGLAAAFSAAFTGAALAAGLAAAFLGAGFAAALVTGFAFSLD